MACGPLASVVDSAGWAVVSTTAELLAGEVADSVADPSVIGAAAIHPDNKVNEINNRLVSKNRFMALPFSLSGAGSRAGRRMQVSTKLVQSQSLMPMVRLTQPASVMAVLL